ncbi:MULTISPECIES: hypothetical protein [unclassified Erwinia]|nr:MULTISPECIES: hypothetical protein [unclassified Erwinia]
MTQSVPQQGRAQAISRMGQFMPDKSREEKMGYHLPSLAETLM